MKCWRLGDYIFGPIIQLLYQFTMNINCINDKNQRIILFIDIFMELFATKIKYPKSKARPIIPVNTFNTVLFYKSTETNIKNI